MDRDKKETTLLEGDIMSCFSANDGSIISFFRENGSKGRHRLFMYFVGAELNPGLYEIFVEIMASSHNLTFVKTEKSKDRYREFRFKKS